MRVWARFLGLLMATASCSAPAEPTECSLEYVAGSICADALAMRLPSTLPQARGNRYGDNDDAAMLGFHLFFNPNIGNGGSCAKCHAPESAFTTHTSVSTGKGVGTRNAPTTFDAARLHVFFWDGRADSLWSQPLFAIENPVEMASTRLALAHTVANDQALSASYEAIFGALPDMSTWPATGKPGDPAFDALPADTQTEVNLIAANIGKALEAYMRKNSTGDAALDRFLAGDQTQLIASAQRGLSVFITQKCNSCHAGSILSDEQFHDVGFPGLPGAADDVGRPGGIPVLRDSIFNLGGAFADPNTGAVAPTFVDAGTPRTFRTPSLRNVAVTAPYGHDGAITTLDELLTIHAPNTTTSERTDLLAFFQTLNGDYPLRPWSNWPVAQ